MARLRLAARNVGPFVRLLDGVHDLVSYKVDNDS